MSILNSLEARRSYYNLNKDLPVSEDTIADSITRAVELVPDAFNCHSARVTVLFGARHDEFWDRVYEVYGGKIAREKIDTFRDGAGTVLYFYDNDVIRGLQEKVPAYKNNFPLWARDANGMLQISVWTALRDLGVGASLQHYNPVIDDMIREFCGVPESYVLVSQMPFGGIAGSAKEKAAEDISQRVQILK